MPSHSTLKTAGRPTRHRALLRVATAILVTLGLVGSSALLAPTAEAAPKSTATSGEFKRIKKGQSLSKVRKIIDGNGERVSTGNGVIYVWKSTAGKRVFVEFEKGKVVDKTRTATVSKSELAKIKNGQSYARVKKIIGGPATFKDRIDWLPLYGWLTDDGRYLYAFGFADGKLWYRDQTRL